MDELTKIQFDIDAGADLQELATEVLLKAQAGVLQDPGACCRLVLKHLGLDMPTKCPGGKTWFVHGLGECGCVPESE